LGGKEKFMALTSCKECGASISKSVRSCPQCGAKRDGGSCGCLLGVLAVPFIVLAVVAVLDDSPRKERAAIPAAEPKPAYMLVCLDANERGISESDPRIARYQRAIDVLEDRFGISEKMIGDQTWVAVDTLRKKGVKTSVIDVMEAVVDIKEADELGVSYAEVLTMLMTIMDPESGQ
jgi:hypothetical protein